MNVSLGSYSLSKIQHLQCHPLKCQVSVLSLKNREEDCTEEDNQSKRKGEKNGGRGGRENMQLLVNIEKEKSS